MIDLEKWESLTKDEKVNALKAVRTIAKDDAFTKQDNLLITDLFLSVEEDKE